MKNTFSKTILACIATVFFFASIAAAADKPDERFMATLNQLLDVLSATDDSKGVAEKQKEVQEVFTGNQFEFDTIIRRTLGRNWTKLTESQQARTKELITGILLRAYTREFQHSERPEIKFEKSSYLNPKKSKIEIPSKIAVRGTTVNLSYRLANLPNSGWQLYDILLEGVSMVSNYRKQFDDHFRTNNSAEELIDILNEKLEDQ